MCSEGLRERYVNPYTNFAFKLLFGTDLNKEILIGFLNALFDGKQVIEDVTYLNTEHLGSKEIDRRAVFDVYCENEKGEKILIEMQRGEQQFFKDRSIYYATYPIREQAIKGEIWDYELKAVYVIGILNFALDDVSSSGFRHEVKLMDTTTHEVFFDKLTFVYLEMPKFHKTEQELDTLFDKWMFVLKNLARLMERPTALQERVFNRLLFQELHGWLSVTEKDQCKGDGGLCYGHSSAAASYGNRYDADADGRTGGRKSGNAVSAGENIIS